VVVTIVDPGAYVHHAVVLNADRTLEDLVRRLVRSADFANEGLLRLRWKFVSRFIHGPLCSDELEEPIDGPDCLLGQQEEACQIETAIGSNTGYSRFLLGLTQGAKAHVRQRRKVLNTVGFDAERAYPDFLCWLIWTTLFAEICDHGGRPRCPLRARVK